MTLVASQLCFRGLVDTQFLCEVLASTEESSDTGTARAKHPARQVPKTLKTRGREYTLGMIIVAAFKTYLRNQKKCQGKT